MISNLKLFLIALSFPLILAGCQTTNNALSEKIRVPCSSHAYDFSPEFSSDYVCLTFSNSSTNSNIERIVYHSTDHTTLVDLTNYKGKGFYISIEQNIKNAATLDFEKQFTSSAKNVNNIKGKQLLSNVKLKFLILDEKRKTALWTAKTYVAGETYYGFSFAKLITRTDKKYQFAGYYMENTNTPMTREHIETVLKSFVFKGEKQSTIAISGSVETRLQ
ncbi:MAG: hypothetical protein V7750_11870 [Sneathiella sp.]